MDEVSVPDDHAGLTGQVSNTVSSAGGIGTAITAGGNVIFGAGIVPPQGRLSLVPAPSRQFTDREPTMGELAELIADQSAEPIIVVLQGAPGIGTSALARMFARRFVDRFPGGDVFVDCTSFGTEAGTGIVNIPAMLIDLLSVLGDAPEFSAASPGALAARLRLKLNQQCQGPVLVVIDHANQPAQVRRFIPNIPGSVVLVTPAPGANLDELLEDGAVFVPVEQLDEQAAADLFHKVSGRSSATSASLVHACDRVPLALVLLAAKFARLHDVTDEEFAQQILDESRALAALAMRGMQKMSAVLTAAYQGLPTRARFTYRCLGYAIGPVFGAWAVGVMMAADTHEAREMLDVLADARLLTRGAQGRYAFANDLVRLHAREQADAEGPPRERREAMLAALIEQYVVHLAFADRATRPAGRTRIADHSVLLADQHDPFTGSGDRATAWARAEHPNLIPITQAAFDLGLLRQTVLLADALTAYYPDWRDLIGWSTTLQLGARAAQQLRDAWAEARLRSVRSRPLADRGEFHEADQELTLAEPLATETGDPALRASVAEFRGKLHDQTGRFEAALDAYDRCHTLNVQAGEWRGVGIVLTYIADTLTTLAGTPDGRSQAAGLHAQALDSYSRALDLFDWMGNEERLAARARLGLGILQALSDEVSSGVATLEQVITAMPGTHYEAQAHMHIADIARGSGETDRERAHLHRALEILQAVHHPDADAIHERLENL